MSEHESYSRSTRHQQKKKGSLLGRNIFTLITVLIVVAVAAGGYWYFDKKHQEAEAFKRFEAAAQQLLAEVQEERNQSGITSKKDEDNTKEIKTVMYIPDAQAQAVPVENPQEALQQLVAETKKKVKKDEKAVIIGKLDVKTFSDQLDQYELVADHYTWNDSKKQFTKQVADDQHPIYIFHKTGQPVTFKDLIPEQADLLGIQQVIQQKLLDQAQDKNAVFDQVMDLPRISYDSPISYTPTEFKITLPDNGLGVKELTLPYKEIAPYINTALVDQETIKDAFPVFEEGKKYVALTFDDGPSAETTPQVLDILKERGAHATFFLLGENVIGNEAIVKRMHDEGNEVASHSFSHPLLTTLDDEQLKSEIRQTDKAIFNACGVLPRNIRAPYGTANAHVAEVTGKPFINWNVDSLDWQSRNVEAIKTQIANNLFEGSIVLMHDIHPETVQALGAVIDNMKAQGYEFVSVDTMLRKSQKPLYQYFGQTDFRLVE